jgi:hypothetical protein
MMIKKITLVIAVCLCFLGCIPGITVSKKDAKIDDRPLVEYQLGTDVEMKDWVILRNNLCNDLDYATEGLPDDIRKNIYKYSCVESDRNALGETLKKLTPGQIDKICLRLTEKGYIAKTNKVLTAWESLGAALLVFTIILI